MRVLITRPGEDGTALAEVLEARGIETVIEPLLAIKYIDGPALDVDGVQALLLTSANGVRALSRRTGHRDIPVYAVGDSTATTARKAGFVQVHSAAGNVETLVGLAKEILNPKDGALLHIAGSEVAGDLLGLIELAGFECTREVLYEAIAERSLKTSTIVSLKDRKIDAVSLYSPRSAEKFVELIRKARLVRSCQRITAICLSKAVADRISEIQWLDVLIAKEPNQDALLKLVIGLDGGKNHTNTDEVNIRGMDNQKIVEKFDQVNVNPATGVVASSLSNQQSIGRTIRTVFITLLILVILIGVGFASKPLWPTQIYSIASILFEEPERSIKLSDLNGRLRILEGTQKLPDFDELQKERKRLQAKLDVTLKRVGELENSINSTKEMMRAVNVEVGIEAGRTLKKLLSRIQKLENGNLNYRMLAAKEGNKTIEKLSEEVAALEQKIPSFIGSNQNTETRSLVLSVGLLRDSVRAGRSFVSELAALKILVDSNQNTKALLSDRLTTFDVFAKSGVPSLHKLQFQFAEKAGTIVQVSVLPSDGGWATRTLARLAESVKWRRTNNLIGDGIEAIVARTEGALKSNDIATAIKEISNLKGKPAELAANWLDGARAYVTIEKALAELQTQVVLQMTTGQ